MLVNSPILLVAWRVCLQRRPGARGNQRPGGYLFNDSHFHLTNYVQEGVGIRDFLSIMGTKTGRVGAVRDSAAAAVVAPGQRRHRPHLLSRHGRAPLLLLVYRRLDRANVPVAFGGTAKRFDPMITGFNPTDMYAADHIRRVLLTFPGVFSGIGEFTIHKEFVSSKVAGEVASLQDPALDRILDFAGEAGLAVILHSDIDVPFPKPGSAADVPGSDESAATEASGDNDHLGTYGRRAGDSPGEAPWGDVWKRFCGTRLQARLLRHLVGSGRQICCRFGAVDQVVSASLINSIRTGFCSEQTKSRPAPRRST